MTDDIQKAIDDDKAEREPKHNPVPPAGREVEVLGYIVPDGNGDRYFQFEKQTAADTELVDIAHVTRLQADKETMRRKNNELNDTVAMLQSELVKARELIAAQEKVIEVAKIIDKQAFAKGTQNVGVIAFRAMGDALVELAHQSAPPDPSADWEDTFGPYYEVDEDDLCGSVHKTDSLLPIPDGYCQYGRLAHRQKEEINQYAPAVKGEGNE